ncbi:hypothetical protein Sste5344_003867 [Sporothrix stenoceras]
MEDPSEASIAEVCEFANLDPISDRQLVIAALRFRKTYTWDESSFMGDRDGYNNSPLPSFNIQGPDDNNGSANVIHGISPSQYHSVPPSRPPSRTQSPLSRMADWTANDVTALTTMNQADEDLERALAMSAAEAFGTDAAAAMNMRPQQESGVTSSHDYAHDYSVPTNLPFFGPANREAYDPNQWAMVRASPENTEPPPSGRKREPGVPVFLRSRKSPSEASMLGAILTILHAIPGARNAMLQSGLQQATYGQNSEWWKGSRIEPLGVSKNDIHMASQAAAATTTITIVDSDEDENGVDSNMTDGGQIKTGPKMDTEFAREFVEEVHRLMAFLDSTDRAYGTADGLTETAALKECFGMETSQRFFEAARRLKIPEFLQHFFFSVQLTPLKAMGSPIRSETYAILEIKVDNTHLPFGLHDLYTAIDIIFWEDVYKFDLDPEKKQMALEDASMATLTKVAPVQIFRLSTPKVVPFQEPFDVPEFFYLDRYMDENSVRALEIQVHLHKVYANIRKIDAAIQEVTTYADYSDNNDKPVNRDRIILSEQAITFAFQKEWQFRAEMVWGRYRAAHNTPQQFDYSVAEIYAAEPITDEEKATLQVLRSEIAVHRQKLIDITNKSQRLQFQRESLIELARRLRRKFTAPSEEENWRPTNKYALRGIIVSPDKFYFCRREAPPSKTSQSVDEASNDLLIDLEESEIKGKEKETEGAEPKSSSSSSSSAPVDQWWMVSYNAKDASPITVQKTTMDVARGSVFQESSSPVLIYSTDASLEVDNLPLSDALRTFVRFDNRFFKQETLEESPRGDKKRQPAEDASPTSPLKRQQRANSIDSMASNMASLGEFSDRDMEDVPLLDVGTDSFKSNNGDRFPIDMDEGVFAATRGVDDGYNVHEWALNRTMEEALAKRAEADGSDWPDPSIIPQREVDLLPGYDETVAYNNSMVTKAPPPVIATGGLFNDHRGSIGTEMVQLAIHGGGSGSNDANGVNGATADADADKDTDNTTPRATTTTSPDHSHLEAGSGSGSQMQERSRSRSQSPGQMLPPPPPRPKKPQHLQGNKSPEKPPKNGEVQLLADWDNPEGRYVVHAEDASKE